MRPGWNAGAVLRLMLDEASAAGGGRVTQEQVADLAGMARSQVNPYFTDRRPLGELVAGRLAEAFTTLGVADAAARLSPPSDEDGLLREFLRRLDEIERRLDEIDGELVRRLGPERFRGYARSRRGGR